MKKAFFDMAPEEQKATLAEEKKQRETMFKDLIEGAPQRKAEADAARRQEVEAQAAEKETLFKAAVLDSYIAANGSDTGFAEAWPTLRAQIVEQRTIENVGNKAASPDLVTRFLQQVNTR